MSLPFFAAPLRQPVAGISIAARAGRYFAQVRAWFSSDYDPEWAYTLQLEHLLAYATWSEIIADADQAMLTRKLNSHTQGSMPCIPPV